MHQDAERHLDFKQNIKDMNKSGAGIRKREESGTTTDDEKAILKKLLDIEADIKDLRDIKDIRDELNTMTSLFRTQLDVFQAMDHITQGKKRRRRLDHQIEQVLVSPPVAMAKRNLGEVEQLDLFASRAAESV